jgi:hypothetical protein
LRVVEIFYLYYQKSPSFIAAVFAAPQETLFQFCPYKIVCTGDDLLADELSPS